MRRKTILWLATVVLFLMLPAGLLFADPIIVYQATKLGGDIWQYDYALSYGSFPQLLKGQGIAIYFAYDLYRNLGDQTPPLADWHTLAFERDVIFGVLVDGEFDTIAAVDKPAIPKAFSVSFEWLGGLGTAPGSQPFVVYDFTSGPVAIIGRGSTTSGVMIPEPETWVLLGLGFVAFAVAFAVWRKKC